MVDEIISIVRLYTSLEKEIFLGVYLDDLYFDTIELKNNTVYLHHFADDLDYCIDINDLDKKKLKILYDYFKSISMN